MSLRHVGERIARHRIGQARGHSHQVAQPVPAQLARNGLFERRGMVPGLKQRPTEVGERPQRPVDCCLGVVDTGVAELGSLAPDPADDAIVSLDQGISDPRLPFHGAHRQDGQPSAVEHLAQAVRKMPLPLPSQAGNTVGR